MSFAIKHKPSPGIIEVIFRGFTTGDDLREATTKCISMEKETGTTRFLIDAVEVNLAASITDLYNLPVQFEDEKANRESRTAVILPKSPRARRDAEFCETACRNRGWSVQTFSERQGAIDWLMR